MVKLLFTAVKVSTDSMSQAESESRRLLKISALRNSLVAGLLIAATATLIAWIFQLAPRYIVQTLIIFTGLLIALTPFLPQHLPLTRFGPANQVTLIRAGIAALIAGLAGGATLEPTLAGWMAGLAGVALLLDGLDGWLARRGGWHSRFGARFDMEIDAFLILALAALVWQSGKTGSWVLLSGALRYGFVALGQAFPWLRQPLPPRWRRQAVCVIQTATLALCLTPWLAAPWATGLAAGALGLLTLSFALDTFWLARQTPVEWASAGGLKTGCRSATGRPVASHSSEP